MLGIVTWLKCICFKNIRIVHFHFDSPSGELFLDQPYHHYLGVGIGKLFEHVNIPEVLPEMLLRVQLEHRCHFNALIVGGLVYLFIFDGKLERFQIITQVGSIFKGHIQKDVITHHIYIVKLHTEIEVVFCSDRLFVSVLLNDVQGKLSELAV